MVLLDTVVQVPAPPVQDLPSEYPPDGLPVGRMLVSGEAQRICQNSGRERYRGSLKGEKPTHFVSEGGHREARIRALAAPEP